MFFVENLKKLLGIFYLVVINLFDVEGNLIVVIENKLGS